RCEVLSPARGGKGGQLRPQPHARGDRGDGRAGRAKGGRAPLGLKRTPASVIRPALAPSRHAPAGSRRGRAVSRRDLSAGGELVDPGWTDPPKGRRLRWAYIDRVTPPSTRMFCPVI